MLLLTLPSYNLSIFFPFKLILKDRNFIEILHQLVVMNFVSGLFYLVQLSACLIIPIVFTEKVHNQLLIVAGI